MSAPWEAGQQCLVVECDPSTGLAFMGSMVIPAVVARFALNGDVDVVTDPLPGETWVATRYGRDDGWNVNGRERSWRLMMPQDLTPDMIGPVHGYREAGDYS
jgi:hypothetical protein